MRATIEIVADSRQVRTATRDLEQLEKRGRSTTTATNQLRSAFAALGGALALRELTRLSDTYTGIQNRLRIVTDSTAQLTAVQAKLLQVANDSRAEFETTVGLYSTLARSTEELGLSQDRLLRVTETINKAFAASGADAATAAGAIRQLGQGLASGALRGDEFNSVAEGAPEIMRAIAAETGMTIGALREFAAEGKITSELLITSLENYGETVDEIFLNSERTISQSFQEARNNAIQFIGGIEAADDASQAFGDSIVALSENLDLVVDAATVLAAVFAGRVAGAIGSNVAAFTAAQIQAARYQATLASMAGVSRTTAVALGGVSLAARGASAALALVGGPIGVAVLAAAGLLAFAQRSETAEDRAKRLAGEVDNLAGALEGLSRAEIIEREQAALQNVFETQQRINELVERRANAELNIADPSRVTNDQREYNQVIGNSRASIERYNLEIEALRKKQEEERGVVNEVTEARKALVAQLEENKRKAEELNAAQDVEKLRQITQSLDDQIYALENGEIAYEVMRAAREANIALDSPEADGIRARISERERLTQAIKDETQADRDAEKAREEARRKRESDAETGQTIGLSDEALIRQQLNEQLVELERLKNENLLSEEASFQERRANLIAEAEERIAQLQESTQLIDWESFGNQATGALAAVATGAMSGREAVRGLAMSLAQEAIGALVKMAVQSTILKQKETAEGVTQAGTLASAYAPAATAASIATSGGAAASGATALLAAVPAMIASFAVAGGRAHGGQVIGGNSYLVGERGPEIVTMGGNGNVTPYNNLMRAANQRSEQKVNVIVENYGSERATVREETMSDERIIRVVVGDINARREIPKALSQVGNYQNRAR